MQKVRRAKEGAAEDGGAEKHKNEEPTRGSETSKDMLEFVEKTGSFTLID